MADMPQTAGAIRKRRADQTKARQNARVRQVLKEAVAKMRRKPTAAALREVYTRADRAGKTGVIHRKKASRLKSRLSRLLKKKRS